jgi:uncharacterized protein (TIGR02285 family)
MGRFVFVIAVWMGTLCAGQACAGERAASWMADNSPPIYIQEGEKAGEGAGDMMLRYIFKALPEYRHSLVMADEIRIFYEMQHRDAVCYLGTGRDKERESFVRYSRRPIVLPSARILIKKAQVGEVAPYLTPSGEIDLNALANDPKLRGGYQLGNPYKGVIADLINNKKRKLRLDPVPTLKQLNALLMSDRLDFYVERSLAAVYYTRIASPDKPMLALRIANYKSTAKVYFACSDMRVGRDLIADIDTLLADDKKWAEFLAPLAQWLEPSEFSAALE